MAQTVVGMLREVIDTEHEVFVFKLVIFLLATLEKGKRENVIRFTHAGGAAVLASLMVISAEKVNFVSYVDYCTIVNISLKFPMKFTEYK